MEEHAKEDDGRDVAPGDLQRRAALAPSTASTCSPVEALRTNLMSRHSKYVRTGSKPCAEMTMVGEMNRPVVSAHWLIVMIPPDRFVRMSFKRSYGDAPVHALVNEQSQPIVASPMALSPRGLRRRHRSAS